MAVVGAYDFAHLTSGKVRDLACYGRDLTMDAGASLQADGSGIRCATGGARSDALGSGDYANSAIFSFIADVTPLDSTAGVRYITTHVRGDNTLAKAFLLSDENGFFGVEIDGTRYSSGVNVLDGKHNLAVVYDFDGNLFFYVDGLEVHQALRANTNYNTGAYFAVGRGATASAGVARAVIDNLRLFNDPVFGESEIQHFMNLPVTDLLMAAYNFDQLNGTSLADSSTYRNTLQKTANGSLGTGKNGQALIPAANTGPTAVGTGLTLGAFDRLNVSMWADVLFSGSAAPFLSLEKADGSPVFRLYRGGSNGLLMKSWRTDDGTADQYLFGPDEAMPIGVWTHIAVDINPTGWNMVVNGAPWAGGTNGNGPTNSPIVSDISVLRVGEGTSSPAAIDDLRIIKNYLNPDAIQRLMNTPVTDVPAGVINNLRMGEVTPSAYYYGAAPVIAMYQGDVKVYGSLA